MEIKITIIGLGYVGLPLAVEFAKKYRTIGYDINNRRVIELMNGKDFTGEVEDEELKNVIVDDLDHLKNDSGLFCTTNISDIKSSNFYIVTVPTPTDKNNRPLLDPLIRASELLGQVIEEGDYVVYESTVYPGVTEDECVPILENTSGLRLNENFFVGYSPERINPGDKERSVAKILKVTSGSNPTAANVIDNLYKSIIQAGTYKAPSIKVAEAAKVIENSQRDINIAFVNELSKIFNLMNIDTKEVLEAAGTKWNFLPFKPGLVGGHCIGVDPFYLAQKAQEVGYHPEIILAGRRINDSMGKYVSTETIKHMVRKNLRIRNAKVLLLGFTFKENCPDFRNTRVIDIYRELKTFDIDVDVYDPLVNKVEVMKEYGIQILEPNVKEKLNNYSAIILAVAHSEFNSWDLKKSKNQVIFDVKAVLPKNMVDSRL